MEEPKDFDLVSVRIYKKTWRKIFREINSNKEKQKGPRSFPQLIDKIIEEKFKR